VPSQAEALRLRQQQLQLQPQQKQKEKQQYQNNLPQSHSQFLEQAQQGHSHHPIAPSEDEFITLYELPRPSSPPRKRQRACVSGELEEMMNSPRSSCSNNSNNNGRDVNEQQLQLQQLPKLRYPQLEQNQTELKQEIEIEIEPKQLCCGSDDGSSCSLSWSFTKKKQEQQQPQELSEEQQLQQLSGQNSKEESEDTSLPTLIQSQQDFQELVLERSHKQLVMLEFTAQWCRACRFMEPVMKKLRQEHQVLVSSSLSPLSPLSNNDSNMKPVQFCKVEDDIRNSRSKNAIAMNLAQEYNIQALPTFVFIRNGQVQQECRGADPFGLVCAIHRHG
jgi:thiol-disulfide isomerase/thioredoxin